MCCVVVCVVCWLAWCVGGRVVSLRVAREWGSGVGASVVVWSGGVCVCVYVLVYGEGWVGLGVGMRRMTDVCGVVCCVERCGVVMCCVLWLWCVVRVFGAGVWFGCVVGVWCGVGGCCRVGSLVWPM